jgi:hypothetical protein
VLFPDPSPVGGRAVFNVFESLNLLTLPSQREDGISEAEFSSTPKKAERAFQREGDAAGIPE